MVSGVDIMVVRELTGDVYFGEPKVLPLALCLFLAMTLAALFGIQELSE